ncbi:MAG: substrate-binding domain-containing protein [Betaproteobacteria bacterium]|nr:substrate-binding domain-containing protein [Betaproteobacteria bacterium]
MKTEFTKSISAALAILLFSAASWHAQAETLEISGGTTPWAEAIEPKLPELKAAGVEIKFNGVGTGRGTLALIDGKISMATVGDTLEDSVGAAKKAAKAENREITVPGNLVYTKIGADEQVVIVHKSNPVTELTKAQLKDIGTGKITNWKDVGGPDLPIKVVVTEPSLAPGQFFKKTMMDGADYVQGAVEVRSPKEVITWVSRTPGGFGAAADVHMKAAPGDARMVKAPVIMRPLGLITVGQPAGAGKKVADMLVKK